MTDNELIAEFMGLVRREANETYNKAQYWLPEEDKRYKGKFVGYYDTLQYHEFWDWLMPVVDKITGMGYDVLINSNGMHNEPHSCDITTTTDVQATATSELLIDCVYKAVVEFIKWYNDNN